MASPVVPPPNLADADNVGLHDLRLRGLADDLRGLVDDIASGAFKFHGNKADSLRAFDKLVVKIEGFQHRVFNRPLYVNGPTILQHAVVSAFRDDNDFRNAGALEIINRLLDNPFVDPKKLSPANMINMVQAIPQQDGVVASDVVAWIRSDGFTDDVALKLQEQWKYLASRIEMELRVRG